MRGFVEVDLPAHCGWTGAEPFLYTLTLADVAMWSLGVVLLQLPASFKSGPVSRKEQGTYPASVEARSAAEWSMKYMRWGIRMPE